MNWYVYCGNNPLVYIDPTGLDYTETLTLFDSLIEQAKILFTTQADGGPTVPANEIIAGAVAVAAVGVYLYAYGEYIVSEFSQIPDRLRAKATDTTTEDVDPNPDPSPEPSPEPKSEPPIPESKPIPTEKPEDYRVYYRGLGPEDLVEYEETGQIFSYAVRFVGVASAQNIINTVLFKTLAKRHQYDSSEPPSPYVSVTTKRWVAEQYADTGKIAVVKTPRAIKNTENPLVEYEYLVPLFLTTVEIINIIDADGE